MDDFNIVKSVTAALIWLMAGIILLVWPSSTTVVAWVITIWSAICVLTLGGLAIMTVNDIAHMDNDEQGKNKSLGKW